MVMGRKIKVAFLEDGAMIGGAEINVLNLMQRMDHNKFETLAICPFEGPFTEKVREIGGVVIIVPRLPLISTSIFVRSRKITNPLAIVWNFGSFIPSSVILARCLRQERIDVLHTNSMFAHFYGALAARLVGARCIWHMQDIVNPVQAFGILRKVINWCGGWLPHRIAVVSNAVGMMFTGNTAHKV
ncbi:MAG TPA: glycosyltransferase, partial [Syntrophales bacterium]|nr:glycosyltransferase [Syntrophales bacterium]